MCVDYDPPEVYREMTRKAVKEHRCDECHRTVDPGERYRYITVMMEGRWYQAKQCAQCAEAARWLVVVCSGYLLHYVLDELTEHLDEVYPIATVQLAKLVVLMRRDWQRKGALVPPEDVRALVDRAVAPYQAKAAA